MSDKDPRPFGYTFSADFFNNGAQTPLDHQGQSLLSDHEGQSLADFFSNTDPFNLSDPQPFGTNADAKLAGNDFSDWNFMAPATVHQVSATIPDHAQLHHGFHSDNMFATQSLQLGHLGTTQDDLQAASTLFNNSQQPAYMNSRSHSFHDMPSSHGSHDAHRHSVPSHPHNGRAMVATSQGLLNEQLAALLPNHAAAGTLDAQLAAQWAGSDAHHRIQEDFGPALHHRPSLKRTYTFGTDDSFSNPAGFSAPHNETEEQVTRRLMRDTRTLSYIGDAVAPEFAAQSRPAAVEEASDSSSEETSSADDSQPSKKRKKSVLVKKEPIRKTAPGTRVSKPKKTSASTSEGDSKKKRASAAASKLARENLSEEQKRSNHILSEQKRRNLIKRGFDDLHDLVPEIRNGGLSKSSVLMEAANFLDKLIADNRELLKVTSGEAAG
ncbi:hypothetical protein E8E11_005358 [Didymella keratinophila]|nr:hypothetical protein E8E11_005358 [Didymella keratinophila]